MNFIDNILAIRQIHIFKSYIYNHGSTSMTKKKGASALDCSYKRHLNNHIK